MSARKPIPKSAPHTAPYWEAAQQKELVLQYCTGCDVPWFYPRLVCPGCMGTSFEWRPASGRGSLHTWIRINRPVPGWQDEPGYVVAMVELEEGPKLMTNILTERPEDLAIDMALTVVFEERDESRIPQFTPVQEMADVQQ